MDAQTAYLERLRPAGGKRSSKRDLIVNVFLHQNGHLSADDLVDLIRQEDHKISRATVYRALQWMVDAGQLVLTFFFYVHDGLNYASSKLRWFVVQLGKVRFSHGRRKDQPGFIN